MSVWDIVLGARINAAIKHDELRYQRNRSGKGETHYRLQIQEATEPHRVLIMNGLKTTILTNMARILKVEQMRLIHLLNLLLCFLTIGRIFMMKRLSWLSEPI